MLLYVSIKTGPKVGLQDAFFGLELAVMTCEGCPVSLLEDLVSEVRRGVEDNPVGFSWAAESSPKQSVLYKAVALIHLDELVEFRVRIRNGAGY